MVEPTFKVDKNNFTLLPEASTLLTCIEVEPLCVLLFQLNLGIPGFPDVDNVLAE